AEKSVSLDYRLLSSIHRWGCKTGRVPACGTPDETDNLDHPPRHRQGTADGIRRKMAERVGFEPTDRLPGQRFSRRPHSTALAPLLASFSGGIGWRRGWDSNPR